MILKIRLLIIMISFVIARPSVAELCLGSSSPTENFKNSKIVFVGVIVKVIPVGTLEIWSGNSAPVSKIIFLINEVFKGATRKEINVHVYSSDARYKFGKKYLIYAREYGAKGLLGAFDCNDPIDYSVAQDKDLKEIKKINSNL